MKQIFVITFIKRGLFLVILLFIFVNCSKSQTEIKNLKTIEVTGIAEMEVAPDEIMLSLGIQEYWLEEFKHNSTLKDCKIKYPIENIQHELQSVFNRLHISKDQITLQNMGNYWREFGKDFLVQKQFNIKISDFAILDSLVKLINRKGISYLNIAELKNKKITDYRKEVKVMALKMAREKAGYLLESIGKKVGDPVTITEVVDQYGSYNYYYPYFQGNQNYQSNAIMNTSNDNTSGNNMRKIKLKYEIKAAFEIN
jgi:uncharacterized protein